MNKELIKGFIIGAIFVLIGVFTIAFTNIGDSTRPINNLACSMDGKIVYVSDNFHVYKSMDYGKEWIEVLRKE